METIFACKNFLQYNAVTNLWVSDFTVGLSLGKSDIIRAGPSFDFDLWDLHVVLVTITLIHTLAVSDFHR